MFASGSILNKALGRAFPNRKKLTPVERALKAAEHALTKAIRRGISGGIGDLFRPKPKMTPQMARDVATALGEPFHPPVPRNPNMPPVRRLILPRLGRIFGKLLGPIGAIVDLAIPSRLDDGTVTGGRLTKADIDKLLPRMQVGPKGELPARFKRGIRPPGDVPKFTPAQPSLRGPTARRSAEIGRLSPIRVDASYQVLNPVTKLDTLSPKLPPSLAPQGVAQDSKTIRERAREQARQIRSQAQQNIRGRLQSAIGIDALLERALTRRPRSSSEPSLSSPAPTITNSPAITNTPGLAPLTLAGGSSGTRTSSSSDRCQCRKPGKRRKCLERASVVFSSGRRKGQRAGSKCIRYAN